MRGEFRIVLNQITPLILTYNEAPNIGRTLEQLRWAKEIVVVDSFSDDETLEIISAFPQARVFQRKFASFADQCNFGLGETFIRSEWVLSLDADERVSEELKSAIQNLRNQNIEQLADGYLIARRSFYMGRWIRGGGWYPDRQLRLFKKTQARWEGPHIHESVKMSAGARVEVLEGDLLHYPVRDAIYHHRMIGERYAPLGARQMFEAGRRTSPLKIASAAPAAFCRSFILKRGFRDGLAGLSIASFAAHHAFLKHLLLWELQKKR